MKIKKLILSTVFISTLLCTNSFADSPNVQRISGKDRYETAYLVNKSFTSQNSSTVVVASGWNFKEALYGSYMATSLRIPFFTTSPTNLSSYIIEELNSRNTKSVYLIGDTKSISQSVENMLSSNGIKVNRIYDKSVYNSATKAYIQSPMESSIDNIIFNKYFPNSPRGDLSSGVLVDSAKFPDLLSSIPFVSSLARRDATFLGNTGYFRNLGIENKMSGFRFIIGGPDSVPTGFSTYEGDKAGLNYHNMGGTTLITGRIYGDDRYKTAVKIAKSYETVMKKSIDTAVIVDGTNFPDALSSGIISENKNVAILLTSPKKLNNDTKKYIQDKRIKNIIVVGGEGSVSDSVFNELKSLNIN